jgi:hypothetical protein
MGCHNTCGLKLSQGSVARVTDFSTYDDGADPLERALNPNTAASANIAAISQTD